jgi:hypothetical protein
MVRFVLRGIGLTETALKTHASPETFAAQRRTLK